MDDITLVAKITASETVYVSPVHDQTYAEYVHKDNLGGPGGYFVCRESAGQYEILAKAADVDAARAIFTLLTSNLKAA